MAAEKCIGVVDQDLLNVCLNLQSQIEGLAVDRWVTVLVGVGAALLTVIGTSWSTHSVQRIERLSSSQRKAIIAVQEAAATLRSNWAQFLEFLDLDRPPDAPRAGHVRQPVQRHPAVPAHGRPRDQDQQGGRRRDA